MSGAKNEWYFKLFSQLGQDAIQNVQTLHIRANFTKGQLTWNGFRAKLISIYFLARIIIIIAVICGAWWTHSCQQMQMISSWSWKWKANRLFVRMTSLQVAKYGCQYQHRYPRLDLKLNRTISHETRITISRHIEIKSFISHRYELSRFIDNRHRTMWHLIYSHVTHFGHSYY